jgi:hypothetical protein
MSSHRVDKAIRRDPLLRMYLVMLVNNFSEFFTEEVTQLMFDLDENTPFDEDVIREQALWLFVEFLTQRHFTPEERAGWVRPHQLTDQHAGHWFNVTVRGDLLIPKDEE